MTYSALEESGALDEGSIREGIADVDHIAAESDSSAQRLCLFCNQAEEFEILEVWSDHAFMIETCCDGLHEAVVAAISEDAERSRLTSGEAWLRNAFERATGWSARRVAALNENLVVDFDLQIEPVTYAQAAKFVTHHHKHCRKPAGWLFGASLYNGPTCVGVIMVGRPVSRMIQARGDTLEVNRLCLNRDLPDPLRWNACSKLYAWAARECKRRGYSNVITYTRVDEPGTSLIAAGWTNDGMTRGGSWSRRGRPRESVNTVRKVRWRKCLSPRNRRSPRDSAIL